MAAIVPFVSDVDDDPADALYKGPAPADDDDRSSKSVPQHYGPSGDGHSTGHSTMPGDSPAATTAPAKPSGSADPTEDALVAPKVPVMDRSALTAAQAKLTTDSAPISKNDPNVKPRWYDRLLGGLAGGLSQDANAGAAVTNRRFTQARDLQDRTVAADQQGVTNAQGALQSQNQDFERNLQGFNAQSKAQEMGAKAQELAAQGAKYQNAIDPRTIHQNGDGDWVGTSYGGKEMPAETPKWISNSPEAKATAEMKQRTTTAGTLGLKPGTDDYKFYLANGKLREPAAQTNIRIPSEGSEQYNDWKRSFQTQNGRQPNADEINGYRRNAPGGAGQGKSLRSIDDAAQKQYDKIETDFQNGVIDQKQLQQKKQAVENQRHQDHVDVGDTKHVRFVYDDAVKGRNAGAPAGQPATAAGAAPVTRQAVAPPAQGAIKAPKSGHQLVIGQQVNVPGKGMRYVTGMINGKVQVSADAPRPGA